MSNNSVNAISRQDFLRAAGILTAGFLLKPSGLFAQTSPVTTIKNAAAKTPVTVQALRGNIYMFSGSGGNISVFNGPDGKLLVDAGIAVSKNKILDALGKISGKPIRYLINSHWHFDHADGNEWVHAAGATIISHRQTRTNLSTTIRVEDWDYTFTPAPYPQCSSIVSII